MKRNPSMGKLKTNYLFPEINQRKKQFLSQNPNALLISLGIGDTTQPLGSSIANAMKDVAEGLGTQEKYSGYGPEQGLQCLRGKISSALYDSKIQPDEIFISDGAKCDLGRLQMLFGSDISVAVQDPAYPVYIEGSIIQGVKSIVFMPCTPENQFFPDLTTIPQTDLIYFCSPNNPTGAAATKKQLEALVQFAISHRSIIIFDSAYANYIQNPDLPKSIYEIEGAKQVAIEVSSFSKMAGFTGVRLGWTVVPEELRYDDGGSVNADWNRIVSTIFNGASNIAQGGGHSVLTGEGFKEVSSMTKFYLENASLIKQALISEGLETYGGDDAPYIWARFKGQNSWDVFQHLLEKYHIICTPGSGFGPSGEEFIRFTAFGQRGNILEAVRRLRTLGAIRNRSMALT